MFLYGSMKIRHCAQEQGKVAVRFSRPRGRLHPPHPGAPPAAESPALVRLGGFLFLDAVYFDVVPNRRLLYCHEMHLDARKISVSLATIELEPAGAGTRLKVTEQGAFLDGYDHAGAREHGTGLLLDRLGASLAG
jgi:activator of Hsp90 ATPase-like protein